LKHIGGKMMVLVSDLGRQFFTDGGNAPEPTNPHPTDGVSAAAGGKATVEYAREGVVRITVPPGSRITAEDGALLRDRFLTLTSGAGAAVLLQVTGVQSVSKEAVRIIVEAVTVTAFATLGTTDVDRVIAHGRRGLPVPRCPIRYFSDEQQALAWLTPQAPGSPGPAGPAGPSSTSLVTPR
jgi:hypothetical protein